MCGSDHSGKERAGGKAAQNHKHGNGQNRGEGRSRQEARDRAPGLGAGEEKLAGRAVHVHSAWLHSEHTARPDSVLARSYLLALLLHPPSASTSLSCLQHMALVTSLLWLATCHLGHN